MKKIRKFSLVTLLFSSLLLVAPQESHAGWFWGKHKAKDGRTVYRIFGISAWTVEPPCPTYD